MRTLVTGLILGIAIVAAAYAFTTGRLFAAREARRDDDCAAAESCLAACWRLPGLRGAIDLEEQLLGVQQGDLRNEKEWHSRVAGNSADSRLILESLAKGNLARFQWMTAQSYAESILDQQPADARALWLRGRAQFEMHLEEQALSDLERAMEREQGAFEFAAHTPTCFIVWGMFQRPLTSMSYYSLGGPMTSVWYLRWRGVGRNNRSQSAHGS